MTLRQRVATLENENRALREKLAVHIRVDKSFQTDLPDAVHAVSRNIVHLNQDQRERVLLAVAVLYGIITPKKRHLRPPQDTEKETKT